MDTRSTFPLLLALACAVPAAVGCNVGGRNTASTTVAPPGEASVATRSNWNPFGKSDPIDAKIPQLSKKDEGQLADAKEELNNPAGLYLPLARWQESDGRLEEARRSYAFVLRENPRNKDGLLGLARLDQLAGRKVDAEERFQQVAAAHPNDAHVIDALGQFYAGEERWPEAARTLDRAARLDPEDAAIRFHVAVAAARAGDLDVARSHFLLAVAPAEAHYNLGYILYDEGRLPEAEREFLAAITKQPSLEQAQILLGELRAERDQQPKFAGATAAPEQAARPTVDVRPGPPQQSQERLADRPSPNPVHTAGHRVQPFPATSQVQHADTHRPANQSGHWTNDFLNDGDDSPRTRTAPTTARTPHHTTASTNANVEHLPNWSPNEPATEWDAAAFESPVRGTPEHDGLTPAQREQLRNQQ